jgi:hypothetical protein
MEEMDLFGVKDPETGEIGYCSIMGMAGEHFALAVYEGTQGLETFLRLEALGEAAMESMELALNQKCLMASFEDRAELQEEDVEVVKALGLTFRGKHAWPLFRKMRPFCLPYFVDAHQARFLTVALQQAVEVSQRFKKDPDILGSEENPTFLVRASKPENGGVEWFDERQDAPAFEEPEPLAAYMPNELALEKIRRLPRKPLIIEMDFVLVPAPVEQEEGPYFPYLLLLADPASQRALGMRTAPPWDYGEAFGETLVKALEEVEGRPQEVRVGRPELLELFSEIETRCEIPFVLADELDTMDWLFSRLMDQLGFS